MSASGPPFCSTCGGDRGPRTPADADGMGCLENVHHTEPSTTFVCAVCGKACITFTTEAEANRELLDSGIPTTGEELLSACDDCYEVVMRKAREAGVVP